LQDATLLDNLQQRLQAEELFDRDRKQPHTRALGILLYYAGLSTRDTAVIVSQLAEPIAHTPIMDWHHRAQHLFKTRPVRYHDVLAIDETSLQIETGSGELDEVFLWIAIDPHTGDIVHAAVTDGRTPIDSLAFLRGTLKHVQHDPFVHVDAAVWYPWPLELEGLDWQVTRGGLRNHVEAWFSALKDRLDDFEDGGRGMPRCRRWMRG